VCQSSQQTLGLVIYECDRQPAANRIIPRRRESSPVNPEGLGAFGDDRLAVQPSRVGSLESRGETAYLSSIFDTRLLSEFEALKETTFRAETTAGWPVLGLRPILLILSWTLNVPKFEQRNRRSKIKNALIWSRKISKNSEASLLDIPETSRIAAESYTRVNFFQTYLLPNSPKRRHMGRWRGCASGGVYQFFHRHSRD
jgi:hypothetical protein